MQQQIEKLRLENKKLSKENQNLQTINNQYEDKLDKLEKVFLQ